MNIKDLIIKAHNYGGLYESTLSREYSEEAFFKEHKEEIEVIRCCTTFVRFNGIKTKCFNPSSKYKVLDDKDEHYLITDDENDVIWVFKQNFTVITE